ncbi:hypothetical protein J0S82_019871 [Galemys pyrenaicus]|uniref:Uncharacterized protein n=1 Tax=Galemys pyrenaicus TaxID=202257 RepID=A0A8J6DUN6_GALPY|nr:hypothetical protein J0S82_019871 [Galemys pyrenaicus]
MGGVMRTPELRGPTDRTNRTDSTDDLQRAAAVENSQEGIYQQVRIPQDHTSKHLPHSRWVAFSVDSADGDAAGAAAWVCSLENPPSTFAPSPGAREASFRPVFSPVTGLGGGRCQTGGGRDGLTLEPPPLFASSRGLCLRKCGDAEEEEEEGVGGRISIEINNQAAVINTGTWRPQPQPQLRRRSGFRGLRDRGAGIGDLSPLHHPGAELGLMSSASVTGAASSLHVIRINKMSYTGADTTGLWGAFGLDVGPSHHGVCTKLQIKEYVTEALDGTRYKFPGHQKNRISEK